MTEWIIKLGPIERTNYAGSKEQAEEGAIVQIQEGVKEIMDVAKPLIPLLQKDFAVPSGFSEPEVKEDAAEIKVYSYHLPNRSWFAISSSGTFGYKLECKKG